MPRSLTDRVLLITGASRGIGRAMAVRAATDGAVNSLWPSTTVASTGMIVAMGEDVVRAQARTTQIMADAMHALVTRPATTVSGHFFTDEELLRDEGWDDDDLAEYRLAACEEDLTPNFYLPSTPVPSV